MVWWGGEGQELLFYPSEAGGSSGNLSSRSPSMWEKLQASFCFTTEQKMLARIRQGSVEGRCWKLQNKLGGHGMAWTWTSLQSTIRPPSNWPQLPRHDL